MIGMPVVYKDMAGLVIRQHSDGTFNVLVFMPDTCGIAIYHRIKGEDLKTPEFKKPIEDDPYPLLEAASPSE